mmetsp:Transcript_104417/g.225320  ORF Transcript_104417/g.225320 Transcript_104417/m.225320 type:complete len:347 (+) Transcript_104417:79-1119(+)|eukprot:CAMPEP_0116933980 /NCGR_PEP_ID=MMETSP0467-20121206/29366_1 /TAXON_ID=283647 /ORGANISM="Mesodinium pulex, Strain SPMC105" /LENGTH=346 /DNA_ID=CAMNT_0004614977 /DNA_START=53 /DNA_END=1093 /DNA_ORIENTATION=+
MLGIRKLALTGARAAARSNGAAAPLVRSMNTVNFDAKERGEEAIYFQHEDARLKAAMRERLEKIMALEEDHEDKKALESLLAKEAAPKADPNESFISKIGLNDWRMALPVGALVAIPALAHEVIQIGPEAQLAAMFVLFVGTVHKQAGPVMSKFFDDYSADIAKKLKQVDEGMLVEVNQSIDEHKQLLGLNDDLTKIMALRDDLAIVQADVLNHQEQHKFRDSIARKLDSLVAIEESASAAIRARMISKVKADVISQFETDAKVKEAALNSAVAVLAAGVGAKRGKDVVGDVFTKSIANYRTEYQKTKPENDPIIVQFEKDVAAVVQAPEVSFQASNVYESHPLQR